MTNSPRQGTATLAVLIDADNAAPAIIEGLLAEVAKYGVAAVKRIYGDWTKPNLSGWKECLLSHSIQPIQQFRYTVGKNATDSAMIIDAMDLLYTERFDGFCLVSSDSDFTRLASRIREQGLIVYGFGERKTPKPFVTACDKFIYSDVLRADNDAGADEAAAPVRRRSGGELRQDSRLVRLLQSASQAVSDEDGWSTLGGMGNHIAKQAPEFDSRNYGYGKLSELVAATGLFEVETRNGGNNKTIWVRLKKRSKQGQEGDGRHAGGQRQAEKPQAHPSQTPAPQPESRRPVAPPEVVAVPVAAPEPEPVPEPVEVPVAAEPVPEPAPVPEVEAPEVVAADVIAEESPAPAAKKPARKRAPRRPDVELSEKPWPIDQSVFAAPGDTVLTAQVQEAFEGFSEAPAVEDVAAEAKPVRKTRRKVVKG
ncbi:NYN domain-containing protein [Cupriavidus numazuensis]|uniref:HTH OST-type domain-containing protein n=1 Tax=Cupriavidus numazuensis TaxID=221992 RepID=A0ABN7Q8R4_9BURK|nr:NYN domain-containing protein [Cupriavidus numazuensis]CAG2158567.1 hypothetical protein LMG26411_06059 [Cupriavidus numazuensis]